MARLGFAAIDAMIGQTSRLTPSRDTAALERLRERGLDFSALLAEPAGTERRYMGPTHDVRPGNDTLDDSLAPLVEECIVTGDTLERDLPLRNTDRTVGAKISSRIARARGLARLPDNSVQLRVMGAAGQSFGAFAARGLTLTLPGEANDYVGNSLSGGRIIIKPPFESHNGFNPEENIIADNVALYGAPSGELYLCGRAGERFAVRNSGAHAVVKGVGDHNCEYMTGGRIAILELTGANFGVDMSGGLAFIYGEDGLFDSSCNKEMIDLDLLGPADETELKGMLERHAAPYRQPQGQGHPGQLEQGKRPFRQGLPHGVPPRLGEMPNADVDTPRKERRAS